MRTDTAIRNELKILREAEKARNEKSQGGMRGCASPSVPLCLPLHLLPPAPCS